MDKTVEQLENSQVPVSNNPCRTCATPCDMGHAEYPTRFDVDLTSEMLGSVKPYRRQIVISTGKSDWEREVTDEKDSLALHLAHTSERHPSPFVSAPQPIHVAMAPGVFNAREASRLSILNGSHRTIACTDDVETVLVFPDYKLVVDVVRSADGAEQLWRAMLDPDIGRAGGMRQSSLRSWPLPYACVILLCSHKRRDNRCHIAAPKLETALTHALESEGYEVHTQLDEPEGAPLEDDAPDADDAAREAALVQRLQDAARTKRVLILKNSHIGGHKYSGNVIIYTPQGTGVWYGRVTPHEAPALVKTTICGGRVLPALLRGGVNLARPQGKDLLSW